MGGESNRKMRGEENGEGERTRGENKRKRRGERCLLSCHSSSTSITIVSKAVNHNPRQKRNRMNEYNST